MKQLGTCECGQELDEGDITIEYATKNIISISFKCMACNRRHTLDVNYFDISVDESECETELDDYAARYSPTTSEVHGHKLIRGRLV